MPLADITPLYLNREWNRLLQNGGHTRGHKAQRPLSAKSVPSIAGVVSSAFHRAVKWRLVGVNPVSNSEPPVPKKHKGMAVLPKEQMLLIESATGPACFRCFWSFRQPRELGAAKFWLFAGRTSMALIARPLTQTRQGLEFKVRKQTGRSELACLSRCWSLLRSIEKNRASSAGNLAPPIAPT
jgi:hypothetical protein